MEDLSHGSPENHIFNEDYDDLRRGSEQQILQDYPFPNYSETAIERPNRKCINNNNVLCICTIITDSV